MINQNMVAKNFNYLWKFNDDKQEVLSKILKRSQGTISQYANGKRKIPVDILAKISDIYGVSTDDLINKDLSLEYDFPLTLNIEHAMDMTFKCFPFFTSDVAKTNDNFNRAQNIIQEIFEIDSISEFDSKICIFEHAIELYEKVWKESKTYIALANSISLIFLIHFIYSQRSNDITEKLIDGENNNYCKITPKLLRELYKDKSTNPYNKKRQNFYLKHYNTVFNNIKMLKKNLNYSDLGDFYLTLCYFDGYILDSSDYENSIQAAVMMLLQQEEIGNHYAKKFLEFFENITNTNNLE